MSTNSGIWTGWNNFYGSGTYSITGDTLNVSTSGANQSALLYWSTVAKPGERITIEYDARTISGVGRITASSRVAYTAYNTQIIDDHADFRSYTFDVEVPTKVSGPQLVFFGVGLWRGDNTAAGGEVEFILRNIIRQDDGGRQMMRPDTFGLLEPETRLILNTLPTEPNKSHTALIDDTIYQLKQAGIWQKLDCLYLLAAPSAGVAAVNWINPGQYNLKEVNSPTFTANQGYSGRVDAVTPPYLQTSFNPIALEGTDDDGNGVADEPWAAQFRDDNNSMFVWATYVEDSPAYIIGTRAHAIAPFSASYATRVYARNGAESGVYVSGVTRESGLYAMSRTNSANFDIYANGISAGNVAQASGVMYSESIQILKRAANTDTCNANIIRCAGFGAALTDDDHNNLNRIISSYMAWVSASTPAASAYTWAATATTQAGIATTKAGEAAASAAAALLSQVAVQTKATVASPLAAGEGVLSVIFDDGLDSAYAVMKPIFDARSIRFGVAVNAYNNDGGNSAQYMTVAQLQALAAAGYEVGNHTWDDLNLTANTVPYPSADSAIRSNARYLRSLGLKVPYFVAVSSTLASDYADIPPKDHAFAFTVFGGGNYGAAAKIDSLIGTPYALKRSSAYTLYSGGGNTMTRLYATIDALASGGGWVCMYDHDPSLVYNASSLSAANWELLLDYAIAQGVRILPPSEAFDLFSSATIKAERIDHVREAADRGATAGPNELRGSEMTSYGVTSATDWWADKASASGTLGLSRSGTATEVPLLASLTGAGWAVDDTVVIKNRTFAVDSAARLGAMQFAADISSGSGSVNTNWAVSIGINVLDAVTPSTVLATVESPAIQINSRRRRYSVPGGITIPSYTNGVIIEPFVRIKCLVAGTTAAIAITRPKLERGGDVTPYRPGRPAVASGNPSSTLAVAFTSVTANNNSRTKVTSAATAVANDAVSVASGTISALKAGTLILNAVVKADPTSADVTGVRGIASIRKNAGSDQNQKETTGIDTRFLWALNTAVAVAVGDTIEAYIYYTDSRGSPVASITTTGGSPAYSNIDITYVP